MGAMINGNSPLSTNTKELLPTGKAHWTLVKVVQHIFTNRLLELTTPAITGGWIQPHFCYHNQKFQPEQIKLHLNLGCKYVCAGCKPTKMSKKELKRAGVVFLLHAHSKSHLHSFHLVSNGMLVCNIRPESQMTETFLTELCFSRDSKQCSKNRGKLHQTLPLVCYSASYWSMIFPVCAAEHYCADPLLRTIVQTSTI